MIVIARMCDNEVSLSVGLLSATANMQRIAVYVIVPVLHIVLVNNSSSSSVH
jgi:hypothetical protein